MKNINWEVEENIHSDIAMIKRILELSDLRDLGVRLALYNGIRRETIFQSMFGNAFLESLISDSLYDEPEAAELIRRDLDALERISSYMKSDGRIPVAERMKKYQFRCDWIRQFTAEYLDGYCLGAPTKDSYLAELSDMETIRKLVQMGHSRASFQFDDIYALMEQPENNGMFHSWLGTFFKEAVHVHTTDYQTQKRSLKRLKTAGWICGSLLFLALFCFLIKLLL